MNYERPLKHTLSKPKYFKFTSDIDKAVLNFFILILMTIINSLH